MADPATLTVQVSEQALARLEALAAQTGQSASDLVDEALTNYLDLHEWQVAAIDDPGLLRECVVDAIEELVKAGSVA